MAVSVIPATSGGAINNGFQPVTSATLDDFSIITDADGVISRSVTVPAGVFAAMSTLSSTLTIGSYSYALVANTVSRINNQTSAASYTLSCTGIQPGFQWRDTSSGFSYTNTANSQDFNYKFQRASIAFGGSSNLFVFIPSYNQPGGATAYSSPDGVTWTSRTLPSANFQFVTFSGSLFFALPNTSGAGQLATSTDGITWTARTFSVNGSYAMPVKGAGTNYCTIRSVYGTAETVAYQSTQVSTDGLTWGAGGTLPTVASWNGAASDGSTAKIVTVAACDSSPDINTATTKAAYSTNNGTAWTASTLPSAGFWQGVRYLPSASLYFAWASSSVYATSPDGITWTGRTFPTTGIGNAFGPGNGPQWIGSNGVITNAFYGTQGGTTNVAYYTTDGINFITSSAQKNQAYGYTSVFQNAAYGNNIHVAGTFYENTTASRIIAVSTKAIASFGIYSPPTTNL